MQKWLKSNKSFHCIRDHPGHERWPISAGLWGSIPSYLQHVFKNKTFSEYMKNMGFGYTQDQIFLRDIVWPQLKNDAYCSDSFTCKKWESSHPFSTNRSVNYEFVGEVVLGNGQRRPNDLATIHKHPVSMECIPH